MFSYHNRMLNAVMRNRRATVIMPRYLGRTEIQKAFAEWMEQRILYGDPGSTIQQPVGIVAALEKALDPGNDNPAPDK